ncbi:DUF4862 family protein [Agrococcus sp. ARC_14]|uniref:DUF4862 family protein n=1 Tax=Agrococcus sp. ARC_14 TaxID=2919927 RepID=UPI001F05AF63|nr:DUF4862 family protein [Agrococcus sp. ARC_14]MCH1881903.1 DUF4862 family protein [Agrococcus sp. ARC_14]
MAEAADAREGWLVGAYAAAPSRVAWDPQVEQAFFDGIWALPGVVGLELPWKAGAFHSRDERWLLEHLRDDAQIVVTTAPDTSDRHRASASFGLAATDRAGRQSAIDATRALHEALPRLREATPDGRVIAVELHAAPRPEHGAASADALRASLEELASWDWGDTRLVVEHCDAWVAGQAPAKGYLPIEDELLVVDDLRRQGAQIGMAINWGRSVIERRDADAGRAHAALAADAGVLDGVVLSGASPEVTPVGGAWADAHAPFADVGQFSSSLLTAARAAATLEAAGSLRFRGVKVGAPATFTLEERLEIIARALGAVQAVTPIAP